jgi:hypothetical protein
MPTAMICRRCNKGFDPVLQPGGLFFGPPEHSSMCEKVHLCHQCSCELLDDIENWPGP